ncbi:hypothetical protein [Nostoc sp. FACHB-110]|uniref:hypothetical protein n=1 Tax=Nostoc sp. FACHB-110 TaxID=2692834 RepID=UPI00168242C9|nr:hypothetical protein [Nostoc sp. FACHB-110]MBD2437626.1 hypothetical protein [Nostoc sp. FACHB-110]
MHRIIIAIGASMLILLPSLANADTPRRSIHDSQILPYLLDNPHENPTVRVRCWPKHKQERERADIRNHLLQSNSDNPASDTVTIEIAGSCRNVKIRLQNDTSFDDYPVYNPYLDEHHPNLDDSWLTRTGSGWYWLLRQ